MDSKDLPFAPISELAPKIASGAVKPGALLEACIGRIERSEPALNAFITKTFDTARRDAKEREAEIRRGILRSPLHGIPVAVKDIVDLAGVATTAGSGILKDKRAGGTATCAARLLDAGALILGKANLQEFARGPTGADSHFGPTRNPWDPDRTSGGSSSGSGAAASSGMAVAALGSDTGGSVRIPAAFCGLAGIRPTYGRVSRAGVVPLGLSFDTLGPLTRTVEDAAIFLQAMAGPDPLDPTTGKEPPPDFRAWIGEGVGGLTFGVPVNHFWPGMDGEVGETRAGGRLGAGGHGGARGRGGDPLGGAQRGGLFRHRWAPRAQNITGHTSGSGAMRTHRPARIFSRRASSSPPGAMCRPSASGPSSSARRRPSSARWTPS